MLSAWTILTPENREEADAIKTVLPLPYGIINQIGIIFPAGSYGFAHIRIFRALHQIIPYNPAGSLVGNYANYVFPEFLYLKEPPRQLELYAWNTSPTRPHTTYIHINVLPPIAFPQLGPGWENQIPTVTENGIITPEE